MPRSKGPIIYTIKQEHRTKSDGRAVHDAKLILPNSTTLILSKDVTDFILIRRFAAVFWLYLQQTAYMTELPLLDIECLTNCSEPIG